MRSTQELFDLQKIFNSSSIFELMDWKIISLVAVGFLALGFIYIFLQPSEHERFEAGTTIDYPTEGGEQPKYIDDEGAKDGSVSNPSLSPGEEGSDGGGGGGSESSEPQCSDQQIPYGLKNLQSQEECISFQDDICTEKRVNCSIEVANLDSETGGAFDIRMVVYVAFLGEEQVIAEQHQILSIEPMQTEFFVNEFLIESSGAEGNANQELSCAAYTASVPKKRVCG